MRLFESGLPPGCHPPSDARGRLGAALRRDQGHRAAGLRRARQPAFGGDQPAFQSGAGAGGDGEGWVRPSPRSQGCPRHPLGGRWYSRKAVVCSQARVAA